MHTTASDPRPRSEHRLQELLPILRCPQTAQRLVWADPRTIVTEDGFRTWPVENWRPILFPGLERVDHHSTHLSNPVCAEAQAIIEDCDGLILNLSAGGTATWHPRVVELETAIFRNTDVVADVHHLPFVDGAFSAVIALNAFEHFRDPFRAAAEISRVLRPNGVIFIHTAFLQPLHEPPWHFFNATKYGVLEWFANDFETQTIRVSDNFNPVHVISWLAYELVDRARRNCTANDADLIEGMSLRDYHHLWSSPDRYSHPVWQAFMRMPREVQEGVAAGFEFLGRKRRLSP